MSEPARHLHSSWSSAADAQPLGLNQVHVWCWFLNTECHGGDEHIGLLDDKELERFHRLRFAHDRARFAHAHANTRRVLGSYLQCAPARVSFRTNPFGKPELAMETGTPSLRFNLSHSREIAVLALSAETDVGIDVEALRPIERAVALDHFSPTELASLSPLQGDAWLKSFYLCWTRKEAIVKAEGVGLSFPLQSFDVSLLPDAPAELLAARPPGALRHTWALHNLSVAEGYAAALALGNPQAEVQCFWLPNA